MAEGTLTRETLALSKFAFEAEHNKDFQDALKQHRSSIAELERSTHDGKILRTDAVRLAKMQMKVHQRRCDTIQAAFLMKKVPDSVLPTHHSAIEEAVEFLTNGKTHIGIETKLLREWKSTNPRPEPPAQIAHLAKDTAPFYTPTLTPNLPSKSFYITYSTERTVKNGGCWLYLKVKAKPDGEDIYSMHALTRKNFQTTNALFYRAANMFDPVLQVRVDPLGGRPDKYQIISKGRAISITGPSGLTYEKPDRVGRNGWTPRRFEFGGRSFVWKNEGSSTSGFIESLFEVEKVWSKPGSKTGKMDDKTLQRKLVWMERPALFDKYFIVHMAGGIDQIFQEYLLASHLAREMVSMQPS